MDWAVVITSAAVGTVVAGAINAVSQWRERRARRQELLLAKAVDLAVAQNRSVTEMAQKSEKNAILVDTGVLAGTYYRKLAGLIDKGETVHMNEQERSRLCRVPVESQPDL